MIAINGIELNQVPKDDPLGKHITSAITRIKMKKSPWILVFDDSKIRPPVPGQPNMYETNAGIIQPNVAKYAFEGMEHDIIYYTTSTIGKGGEKTFMPPDVKFTGTLPIDAQKQADLIFFMVCVLSACAPYDWVMKYQQLKPNADIHYKVQDLVSEASIKNVYDTKAAKVSMLIYDEDFGLKEPHLRELALNHGVSDALDININLLRQHLKKTLLTQVKGVYNMVKISAFLEDVKNSALARLRKNVSIAVKEKYIIIAPNSQKNPSWYDVNAKGEPRARLMTIPENADPETSLVQELAKKKEDRIKFEAYVENGGSGNIKESKKQHVIEEV